MGKEKLLAVEESLARELEEICAESECSLNVVLRDLIDYIGGKDMATIQIYHQHHKPKDDDVEPPVVINPESFALFSED